jgi:hypothetical protein
MCLIIFEFVDVMLVTVMLYESFVVIPPVLQSVCDPQLCFLVVLVSIFFHLLDSRLHNWLTYMEISNFSNEHAQILILIFLILTFPYCQICFFTYSKLLSLQKKSLFHSKNPILIWSIWILLCLGVHLSCFCLTYEISIDVNLEFPVSYSPKFCGGFYDPS